MVPTVFQAVLELFVKQLSLIEDVLCRGDRSKRGIHRVILV